MDNPYGTLAPARITKVVALRIMAKNLEGHRSESGLDQRDVLAKPLTLIPNLHATACHFWVKIGRISPTNLLESLIAKPLMLPVTQEVAGSSPVDPIP